MRKFCFALWVLLSGFSLCGKGQSIETLQEQLQDQLDDEAKAKILITLADQLTKTDPQQALGYAEQALSIGETTQNKKITAQAQYELVFVQHDLANYNKSIEYALSCEPFFIETNDYNALARLYNSLSTSYFYIGDAQQTDEYSDKSIELAEKYHIQDILIKQYYNRGAILVYRGDYSMAMSYALKALDLAKEDKYRAYLAPCYELLGSLSKSLEQYNNALEYYERAREIYFEDPSKTDALGYNYVNAADIYRFFNQMDTARQFYDKALSCFKTAESPHGISLVYLGVAVCYKQLGKYDSAQIYVDRCLKIGLLSESKKDMAIIYAEAGEIYYFLKNYESSLAYLYKSLRLAEQNGFIEVEERTDKSLSKTYFALHRSDSAYRYLARSVAIRDSIALSDKVKARVYTYAEHYVKEQIEKEAQAKEQRQKLLYVIFGLCLLVIFILSFSIYSLKLRQNKIQKMNAELKKYKTDLEGIVEDKTRELVQSEQQFFNLGNNLPNGAIFRFAFENERKGQTLYVSSGWEELTGQSLDAARDSVFFFQNKIHPDDSRELLDQLAVAINNHSILDVVYRFYKNNTEVRWFHVRAIAVAGNDGLTYLDGYQVDETEQKHFEQELVAAKEKAEESDRLKSAFLANMSHEIRTPMNAIIGFASLLSNGNLPPQRQSVYLDLIQDNCYNLLRLIDDIVDISKIEAEQLTLRMELCRVSDIMKEIKGYFESIIQSKYPYIELWIDENSENTSLTVYTDLFRVKQIFINLIENALKFTEKGFVRCGHILDIPDMVHFYVMDTGVGIAAENIDLVFQSFRKVDEYSSGTGLGLSIVKKLLLQMGGTIWVESELGVGSTFHFTLPMSHNK